MHRHLAYLAGGGAMGKFMRSHDWSTTAVGDPATWSLPFRTSLSLCINSKAACAVLWGTKLCVFYNDAYRAFLDTRHPWALGRPICEIWPTLWEAIGVSARQVYETGEGIVAENQRLLLERNGSLVETYWYYSFAPIRSETGEVVGILLTALDSTDRYLAERQQAFRLALEDQASGTADPLEGLATKFELLGRHLGVNQVIFAEAEADDRFVRVTREWNDGTMPRSVGRHRLDDFGPPFIAELRRGKTVVIQDVREDPRTSSVEALATFTRASVVSFLNVPLIRDGRLVMVMGFHSATPHVWTLDEVALAKDVTVRAWDALERVRAEDALRESEQRLQLALGASGTVGLFDWHVPENLLYPDTHFAQVYGIDPDQAAGGLPLENFIQRMHPDDRSRVKAAIDHAVETCEPYDIEYRVLQPGGDSRWLHVRGRCIYNERGKPTRFLGTAVDIHARKLAEARQSLLSREVDHRAKNALAVVQASLRLTRAPDLPSYVKAITGRVAALARAQTLLADEQWAGADLRTMLEAELDAFLVRGTDGVPRAFLDGPTVALPASAAQPLAMAVHELATNAVKHGALSTPSGLVSIIWSRGEGPGGTFRLMWVETGGPPIADPPTRKGFGSRVLDGVIRTQLGGTIHLNWSPTGLVCDIELPLEHVPDGELLSD